MAPLKLKKSVDHRASNSGWAWGSDDAAVVHVACADSQPHDVAAVGRDLVFETVFSSLLCRYMNPVWEHWECESIGGKGDKVDAYMYAPLPVVTASCPFLSARP
jgi:hypothetical protein